MADPPGLDIPRIVTYLHPMWTRKRTVIAGRAFDDDWTVFKDRRPVGRVYATHIWDEALSWMWHVQVQPVAQGYAPSLEAALEEVRRRA